VGRHVAKRRWFGHGRTRALLSLGIVLVLGVSGTYAYWTDSATVNGGTITSGTLDLTAGPTSGSEQLRGQGGTWTYTALALADMIPNESVSRTIVVRNSGSAPLTFNLTAASTTNALTSGNSGLRVQIYDQSTAATQTGTPAAGNRSGGCTGGTLTLTADVSTTPSANLYATAPTLQTGQTRSLCVRVWLNSAAPNSLQSNPTAHSTQIVLNVSAQQAIS